MKWCVCILFLISSVLSEETQDKQGVLKRVTRQALGNMGNTFLAQTETNIISNCKANGLDREEGYKLQRTYDDMKDCLKTKRIFSVPKSEYIDHMTQCAQDSIKLTEKCLKSNQKYFPEFVLDLSKSVVNFMYDDKPLLTSRELPVCMMKFSRRDVQTSYIDCLISASRSTHDDQSIPSSKAEFCRKFLTAGECFPKTINQYCGDSEKVVQFSRDYMKAMEQPCQAKEVESF